MTKNTRIRVARIAAGAVIAVGASLTAAGAASALDLGVEVGDPSGSARADEDVVDVGVGLGLEDPTEDPTAIPTDPTVDPTTEEPPTEKPTEAGNGGNGNGGNGNGGNGNGGNGTGGGTGGGDTGGGNDTDPDGGSRPVEQGQGKESLTDTGSEQTADPSARGTGGAELAETGAAETTFLLIGAATMIAGGIGFRMLPRLMNSRGAAA